MRRTITVALVMTACLPFLVRAEETRIDLAAIVTKSDAQNVLGETVKDPQARNEDGADGFYSRCNYYSENPGRSLTLRVRQTSPGQLDPKAQLEEMSGRNEKLKPLTGLGDKAAVINEGPAKGPGHVLMLYVAKGNAFITVGISGVDDEKNAMEKAKTLAKKIMGKL
jgi:hypothetical protein